MAQIFPSLEQIKRSKVKPEAGELSLLAFLEKQLPDEYEVYFQPFLNGDRPDIIVMRQGSGVLIVEVKDWRLSNYSVDGQGTWHLASNNAHLKSPIEQVTTYKDNLYNLHIDHLLDKKIKNDHYYAIISCAVYFHLERELEVTRFCADAGHTELLGHDSLTLPRFESLLSRHWLNKQSRYFTDDLYTSFKRYLQPPLHAMLDGIEIIYKTKQRDLIESRPVQQKVRGVAGSGKTKVLAKRAVNAYIRTNQRILILTYNITLRNYIHDRISEVRENFSWDSFYITHYHLFFATEANNHGLKINNLLVDCYNETFFESVKNSIEKFSAIFIDEIQDQETQWIRMIKKYFLEDGGELVVFGDEKQNVYQRQMAEDRKPNTTIVGRWNELNDSFRASSKIIHVAFEFQDYFFNGKYDLDDINIIEQLELFNQPQFIRHTYFDKDADVAEVYENLHGVIEELGVHPNDICIVASKVELLRGIDSLIKSTGRESTTIAFETQEEFDRIVNKLDIDALRRCRKFQFWMNTGMMKLATIHSFKGWEVHTLILIIDDEQGDDQFTTDELIYTAITRCKQNLMVLNLGNLKYKQFFEQCLQQ